MADTQAFLEVKNLCKYFTVDSTFFGRPTKFLKAVDGVSFRLEKGKTLGIVGESGCGKTTMGRTLLRLYDVTSGEVYFKGREVTSLKNREFDKLRPDMQMIFQDPYASLSPRLTVGEIIGEAVKQHKLVSKSEYHDYIMDVMKMCGLQPHYFERYPHEFSGGQRQRICIARALALKPELVICDEPVSALDVSIQAQIINMLIELRKTLGLTYIFISHDLSVVKHISDEVGVMYLGSMVEYGSKDSIFENTLHPYTKALFSAVPVPNPHVKMNRIILKGDIPSPVNPPSGCKFHTRCESCMEICSKIAPPYKEVEPGHFCACHLYVTDEEKKELEERYEEQCRIDAEKAEHAKKNFWKTLTEKFVKDKSAAEVTHGQAADIAAEQTPAPGAVAEQVAAVTEAEIVAQGAQTEESVTAAAAEPIPAVEPQKEEPAAEKPAVEESATEDTLTETPVAEATKSAPAKKPAATGTKKPTTGGATKTTSSGAKKPAPTGTKSATAKKPATTGTKSATAKKPAGTATKSTTAKKPATAGTKSAAAKKPAEVKDVTEE